MQIHPLSYHSYFLNRPLDFVLSHEEKQMVLLVYFTPDCNCSLIARHKRAFALCICSALEDIKVFCVLKIRNLKQSGCLQLAKS